MKGGTTITPDQKEILMVHLVRDEAVLRNVAHLIEPEDFDAAYESWFFAIWDITRKHWTEYGRKIGREHMMSQLKTYVETSSVFVSDGERDKAMRFADIIFKFPEDQIITEMGLKLAQRFIDDRRVRPIIQGEDDVPIEEIISNAEQAYRETRIRGRVPSQADRMDEYAKSLTEEGTIIPVTCFRMRQPPITNDPEHPEHPRSEERSYLTEMLNGGLIPGEITVIGGRSGVGKSSFGLQMADGIAADNTVRRQEGHPPVPVLYVSNELHGCELFEMSLARLSLINGGWIHGRSYLGDRDQAAAVEEAAKRYAETIAPYLRVMDCDFTGYESITVPDIRRQVSRLKADFDRCPSAVVIIDPLQRLVTGDKQVDRDDTLRVGQIIKELLVLTKKENVALIVLSDSTKAAVKNAEGRGGTGELGFRDSYMINHLGSTLLYLETGDEFQHLFPQLYKGNGALKSEADARKLSPFNQDLLKRIGDLNAFPLVSPEFDYMDRYKSTYAAALCSKRRWAYAQTPVFIYHRAVRLFEEIPV